MTPLKLICRSSFRDLFSNSMLVGNHVWTARNTASFLLLLGEHRSFWSWGWSSRTVQYWNDFSRCWCQMTAGGSWLQVRWWNALSSLLLCLLVRGTRDFPRSPMCFFFPLRERKTWKQTMASKGTNILKQCKHAQIWRNWWLLCLVLGHMNVDLSGTQTPIEKKVVCQVESKLPKNWLSVFGPFW